ncbi:MAG TPA: L,D-transpeptidase, partial [Bradyrhizobium sp.]|nr:L,D-transpeptidase [Bradyrhizobium sp.]
RETAAGTNDANPDPAKPDSAKPDDVRPDTAKAADTAKAESAPSSATDTVGKVVTEAGDTAKNDAAATSRPVDVADAATPADKAAVPDQPADIVAKPETKPEIKPAAADARKDQTRLSGSDKPPKPDARRKEGQLAVFISRKDSKLYVRQNFAPAWEIPVTIAPSDRPLGTHVFTAVVDKTDSNLLHWSVVSVPMSARAAMRASDEPRSSRRKGKQAPVAEARPAPLPDNPAEALDRITIPPDAMTRISEAMASGGSIIVSDQGINQGETGEYTDFIIRTY